MRYGSAVQADRDFQTRALSVTDLIPGNINLIEAQPLTLELTDWLYCSDLHVPLHNREYIRKLIDVGTARGVRNLIVGGDLWDFASISKHGRSEKQAALQDALEVGGDLLLLLAEYFDVYILPGNHDERMWKRLDDVMDFAHVVWGALAGRVPRHKIVVTNYDYIYIGPPETGWVVGHPRYFSTIPAKGGADVAMIQHRNVIGAHNHIQGMMRSRCGRYLSIDPGHMTEPELTPYKMKSEGLSRYPAWTPGFVLVQDNVPTICSDGLVNWADLTTT